MNVELHKRHPEEEFLREKAVTPDGRYFSGFIPPTHLAKVNFPPLFITSSVSGTGSGRGTPTLGEALSAEPAGIALAAGAHLPRPGRSTTPSGRNPPPACAGPDDLGLARWFTSGAWMRKPALRRRRAYPGLRQSLQSLRVLQPAIRVTGVIHHRSHRYPSCAPNTSAHPRAMDKSTVLRAGTYVTGIPALGLVGTVIERSVTAEPPHPLKGRAAPRDDRQLRVYAPRASPRRARHDDAGRNRNQRMAGAPLGMRQHEAWSRNPTHRTATPPPFIKIPSVAAAQRGCANVARGRMPLATTFLTPQKFMQLHPMRTGRLISQNPFGRIPSVPPAPRPAENRIFTGSHQLIFGEFGVAPFVIGAVTDNEFHLILGLQQPDIGVEIFRLFPRARGS